MDRFLSPQAEEQLLNEIRTFLCDGPQEIIGETVQVSSIDLNNRDVETIQTRTETLSIDNQDILFKIPVKSTKGTTMSLLETPTKRRKISTEEIRCAQTPSSVDMALLAHAEEPASQLKEPIVPESVAEPAEISVQGPVALTEVPIPQVQVIEGEELILESRRGGIKIVDKKILLSSIEMQRWITNVHAHTKTMTQCEQKRQALHTKEHLIYLVKLHLLPK
ncbi:uncharacterized protein LOC143208853 [Lasioglossum baleicum]|uniref:uncharacterized protein LOC143208853 n=1 Tax=Lasioglossum baleicum TaxID=434251 RepID=UPI003FCD3779